MDRRSFHRFTLGAYAWTAQTRFGLSEGSESAAWPGWRGPERTAYVTSRSWPSKLDSDHLKLQWDVPLDRSYSGPVVVGDLVMTTESRNKKEECVIGLDRSTGQKRWEAKWEGAMIVPFFAASNGSWIRSTPVTDGSRLFAGGMCDYFVCLDVATGRLIYAIDFKERFGSPMPAFGQVCSPLLDRGRIYIQSGGGLLCLDADSGDTLWRTMVEADAMMGSAFSSPIIATLHNRRQLIVQTRSELCGVELADGEPIWRKKVETFRGMNILTPTIWNDCVFTSSYGGKSQLVEFEPSRSELWKASDRWTSKAEAYMSSPILIDDHLYVHLRNQRLVCLNCTTGEERWRSRPYGKYWSMVTNGKQILALDEQGKLLLINAKPDAFELVDERVVSKNECWAHLAIVDQQVFVRHLLGLSVFQWG
jgi:outer membrane protein assembly factor BamB